MEGLGITGRYDTEGGGPQERVFGLEQRVCVDVDLVELGQRRASFRTRDRELPQPILIALSALEDVFVPRQMPNSAKAAHSNRVFGLLEYVSGMRADVGVH